MPPIKRGANLALEHAPAFGGRQTALRLIEALEDPVVPGEVPAGKAAGVLAAWAGSDLAASPGGWRRWWTRKFGR
jgi:hypothetical protein